MNSMACTQREMRKFNSTQHMTKGVLILPLSNAGSAAGAAVCAGNSLLTLLAVLETSGIHVLDL